MVLDHIPQCLPVHIFGSRPQPPTSPNESVSWYRRQTHLLSVSKHETDSFVVCLMFFIKKKKVRLCHIWFWGVIPPHYGLPCLVANMKVSFAKEPYKRDYILQKRPIIWRSLLIFSHSKYEGVFCEKRETRLIHICCEGRETVKGREDPPPKNGMSLISFYFIENVRQTHLFTPRREGSHVFNEVEFVVRLMHILGGPLPPLLSPFFHNKYEWVNLMFSMK